jgi:hypothetical protein
MLSGIVSLTLVGLLELGLAGKVRHGGWLLVEVWERVDVFVAMGLCSWLSLSTQTLLRECGRKEKAEESIRKTERAQTIYQRVLGWDGMVGVTRPAHEGGDVTSNHVPLAPRTGRPKEAAVVGGLGNS